MRNKIALMAAIFFLALCFFLPSSSANAAANIAPNPDAPSQGVSATSVAADAANAADTLPNCTASFPLCAPGDCKCINNQLQCAQLARAQHTTNAVNNFIAAMPKIDLALYNCLGQIDKLLSQAQSPSFTDALLDGLVDAIIGQACNAVTSSINQINGFVLSQANRLCIPGISGGIGSINLGLKPATCNGTPLLQFTPGTNGVNGNTIGATLDGWLGKASQ